jgi:prepilin-type N-terminal cleavage/methylation domain-containing protein
MENGKRNNKGLTLVELMIVIAMMGIFASIVYVNLSAATKNSKAGSVLQSMTSVAPLAYKCLIKSANVIRITDAAASTNICNSSEGISNWPDIAKTDWGYNNFYWCNVNYSGTTHPTGTNVCNYADGSCGGVSKYYISQNSGTTVKFCYGIKNDTSDKYIWCTDQGCQKEGF